MADYISREAAIELFRKQAQDAREDFEAYGGEASTEAEVLSSVADELEDLPSVDVAPVAHGRWETPRWAIKYPNGMCSECGWVNRTRAHCAGFKLRFCPACGAKMDKEE